VPAQIQHHTLSSRRWAHRRTVDESGSLLGRITGGDPFASLLSAVKAVVG
jgi:hypothetical protein